MQGHDQLDPTLREAAIVALKDYLRGGGKQTSLLESQTDLDCSGMLSDLMSKVSNTMPQDQTGLHFKLALYRGLRYAGANSYYCMALSYSNELRQLYEGQRLLLLHPQTV